MFFGGILRLILTVILCVFVIALIAILNIAFVQMFNVLDNVIKSRQKHRGLLVLNKYSFIKHLKYSLLVKKYIFPVELIKWLVFDLVCKNPKIQLFGIRCVVGYFGTGKSMFCVYYAHYLRKLYMKKWGIYVNIYANFNVKGQNGYIKKWQDLLDLPKYTIVIFDEIQSTFTSAQFKDFPIELLWKLTQCRKLGLMVLASSPVFSRMTIQLRENTDFIICAKNVLNTDRWFNYQFYYATDYEQFFQDNKKLKQYRYKTINIVSDNRLRNMYDTTQIVSRLDITNDEPDKISRNKISGSEISRIENNLKKFVLEEIKKYKIKEVI